MSDPASIVDIPLTPDAVASIANQKAIEDAIHFEIYTASGLPPGRVIWENQSRDRPGQTPGTRDLITLRWGTAETFATATPEITTADTIGAPAGQEVTIQTIDHDQLSLTVTYYAGLHTGNTAARSRLKAIRNTLNRDVVIDRLQNVSSVALIESGSVQLQPVLLETEYESRAYMVLRLGVAEGTDEKVTNIETVEWSTDFTT